MIRLTNGNAFWGSCSRLAICAAAVAVVFVSSANLSAALVAEWSFETSAPATAGPHNAEGGLNAGSVSQALGFHVGAAVYSSPAGNGTARSFSSNTWAVGDYYQFSTSTTGHSNLYVQWEQVSSN